MEVTVMGLKVSFQYFLILLDLAGLWLVRVDELGSNLVLAPQVVRNELDRLLRKVPIAGKEKNKSKELM